MANTVENDKTGEINQIQIPSTKLEQLQLSPAVLDSTITTPAELPVPSKVQVNQNCNNEVPTTTSHNVSIVAKSILAQCGSSSVGGTPRGRSGSGPYLPPVTSCSCPSTVNTACETVKYFQCPVCLAKFDSVKVPIGLKCGHTLCLSCVRLLVPESCGILPATGPPSLDALDLGVGLPSVALLSYLDQPVEHLLSGRLKLDADCVKALRRLVEIAVLTKSHVVSRAIHRKLMNLLTSVNPVGQARILKSAKAIGERTLVELTSSCSNLSHYQAQQQLWAAIRARACQFMGPAMQEEALKLVLLALEDGSALSRKVLVMFVVQRLAPQFPQASKTSVGHIVQLLYRSSTFDVIKRPGNSSLMTLRPEYRNYEALRREHDIQIMKIGLEAGIRFTPEQWSSLLYGDTSHKPLMQSIIDKLQAPQTFSDLLKEFLVCAQRLNEADSQSFLSIYPHFQTLSAIEIPTQSQNGIGVTTVSAILNSPDSTPTLAPPPLPAPPPQSSWKEVEIALESVRLVLSGLVSFEKPATRKKFRENHPQGVRMVQRVSLT